nr:PREDICTED: uncharacterized protein LOC105677878 [Linepithema humile]XP_012232186.1 PREDICTED: uncharacterized protein LOC105677878 [Linepithema humile]
MTKEHGKKLPVIMSRDKQSLKYHTEKHYFFNKCYTKPVDLRTKCRFCKGGFEYVTCDSLKLHIKEHTFIWKNEESKKNSHNKNWLYFRFTKQETIECILCKIPVLNDQMENHAKDHIEEGPPSYIFQHWSRKYVRQEEDNMICIICEKSITVYLNKSKLKKHMLDKHKDEMKRINEEEIFWKSQTEKKSWLQEYYTDDGDFRAECKFCERKVVYIKETQFKNHVNDVHYGVHHLEEHENPHYIYLEQWNYVRYTNDIESKEPNTECMICQKNVTLPHIDHYPREIVNYAHHWALKYARQNGHVAKCTICETPVDFECDVDNLENHVSFVHQKEWKKRQEKEQKIE